MSILQQLSNTLVEATEQASQSVVAIAGGTRFGASGVLWQPGVCVTTRSTIRRDEKLRVTLPNRETVPASLAGHDDGTDIAVLTFESSADQAVASRPAPPAAVKPGEVILAVGRAENTGVNSVFGLISAVGPAWQTWQGGKIDRYLRLDLSLYPGGSGAAVVNTSGELVGMASGVLSRLAPLAIPFTTIDRVAAQLTAQGRIRKPWLGVAVHPVPVPSKLTEASSALTQGLIILTAEETTPAGRAGILVGDILISLDNTPLSDPMDLRRLLAAREPGDKVHAVLLRGGERVELEVELSERNGRQ
jgi:S1-C subfamily serine protease